jgi:glycosyltransferase involved in cell wall biosynthesis
LYNILIIGTTTGEYGGTSVSLLHLIKYLKKNNINFQHLETGGVRKVFFKSLFPFIKLIINLIKYSKKSNLISAHLNNTALPILGPFIFLISKLTYKPYTIRIFGGFGYENKNSIIKFVVYKVLKNSQMYFAQTKKLYDIAKKDNLKVTWFPTTRPTTDLKICSNQCKKFVYIGRIIEEKGIFEILNASKLINSNISIDIYGPLQNGLTKTIFQEYNNVNYNGIIDPKDIYTTLVNYDLLLFPTYYPGEGYPGIIIEALNVGMPIICTNWLEINDLVDNKTAIIIEPKNHKSLAKSINNVYLNKKLYKDLCIGAQQRSRLYSMEALYNNFVKIHLGLHLNEE